MVTRRSCGELASCGASVMLSLSLRAVRRIARHPWAGKMASQVGNGVLSSPAIGAPVLNRIRCPSSRLHPGNEELAAQIHGVVVTACVWRTSETPTPLHSGSPNAHVTSDMTCDTVPERGIDDLRSGADIACPKTDCSGHLRETDQLPESAMPCAELRMSWKISAFALITDGAGGIGAKRNQFHFICSNQ